MIFRFKSIEVLNASFTGHIVLFRLLLKPCSIIAGHTLDLAVGYTLTSHLAYKLINPVSHSSMKLLFALTDRLLRTFAPIALRILSAHAIHDVRVPRHVFQARTPSRNSTKYRADDFCGNLICEYFCWMLDDPHFFFGRPLSFLVLSFILKNKKNLYVGSSNYFSYTIQIGSNWYMETGVRDL